ncbi:hypothetical protein AJ78_05716 [Emergomyces pasteurianus Ep9510]|uniref:Thioesterase domain-containing protein n=1 Tax=Emergomyces pasteurianus Ep9510 TaxID=1447872 RepID=A0A1J9QFA8_9EURO|nr:hypothetical protein AJ78_05716 [Emergomyces pasteurianus Ep9510]
MSNGRKIYRTYREFINNVPVPQADIDFFSKIACAKPYIHNTSMYRIIPFPSRFDKGEDTTDRFFSNVINTPETIPQLIAVMRRPESNPNTAALLATGLGKSSATSAAAAAAAAAAERNSPSATDPDYLLFVQLGPSLSGFRDTVHGGVLATLFDEALGNCVEGFRQDISVTGGEESPRLYTAKLDVSYRSPVETPGIVVVKAWLKGVEGRKWFLDGQIAGEDGTVRAEAKSLWVMEKTTRGKHAAVL